MYWITQRLDPVTSGCNEPELFIQCEHNPHRVYAMWADHDHQGEIQIDDSHEYHLTRMITIPTDNTGNANKGDIYRITDPGDSRQWIVIGRAIEVDHKDDNTGDYVVPTATRITVLTVQNDDNQTRAAKSFIDVLIGNLIEDFLVFSVTADPNMTTIVVDSARERSRETTLHILEYLARQPEWERLMQVYVECN